MDSLEDEVLLEFKRFPKEKQDQVRGLVNYATLMGLDGKDLISIGGKLDRLKVKQEIKRNRQLVESMNVRPIGQDIDCRKRWAYIDSTGVIYHFTRPAWYDVHVKNTKTGKSSHVGVKEHYDLGRYRVQYSRELANVMLNVYHGHITLP